MTQNEIFLVELRVDHKDHFETDAVAACTTIEKARAWIQSAVKAQLFPMQPANTKPQWFAICSQKLDADVSEFGVDSELKETYSMNGENLQGNQP